MWLVVGLGNPGAKYERNRHNVGFRVVDELARRHGLSFKGTKLGGDTCSGVITVPTSGREEPGRGTPRGRERAALLKPMEFMNLSGFALQRTAKFHEVEVDKIVVVHDEVDLDFGTVRVKSAGGHGGHNGLRSIIEQLGKSDFQRVRVGVGKQGDTAGWVLSDFPAAQHAELEDVIQRGADAVEAILGLGVTAAMNQFNGSGSKDPESKKDKGPRSPQ